MTGPALPPLVLLAAGESRRMGSPKGLVPCHGTPWLECQVEAFFGAGGARTLVVVGYHRAEYFARMPWLEAGRADWSDFAGGRVRVVENPAPQRGQFSSLQCGIGRLLEGGDEACLLLPLDAPLAGEDVLPALVGGAGPQSWAAIPTCQGRRGHPVLLREPFLRRLLDLDPGAADARLDRQIAALPAGRLVLVETGDPLIRLNLNTPADFQAFRGSGGS